MHLKVDSYSVHHFLPPSIHVLVVVGFLMSSGVEKSSQNFSFSTLLFHLDHFFS